MKFLIKAQRYDIIYNRPSKHKLTKKILKFIEIINPLPRGPSLREQM